MPRSTADPSGGTLLRTVLAKSPLSLITKSDDEKPLSLDPVSAKRRHRPPSFLSHKRSNSQQTTTLFTKDINTPSFKPPRQRSLSHNEQTQSSSLSKAVTHSSVDHTDSADSASLESTNESQQCGDEKFYGKILHHGDAQTSHTGWRKKYEYLVLTEQYLLRFKNAKKAAHKFPWLFPINSQIRPARVSQSVGSLHDVSAPSGLESPTDFSGTKSIIPLQRVIAVQNIQESRNRVTLEVIWQTSLCSQANTISLTIERIAGRSHWLESLSTMAKSAQSYQQSRSSSPVQSLRPNETTGSDADSSVGEVQYTVFRRHTIVGDLGYSPLDDLSREPPAAYSLIISQYKVDILPLTRVQKSSGTTSSIPSSKIASFGIISLRQVSASGKDDSFDLVFRNPQQPPISFELASIHYQEIIQTLHLKLETLKPNWTMDPYLFRAPGNLSAKLGSIPVASCPLQDSFDRVLEAHCAAWGLLSTDIIYSIVTKGEDAPCFRLIPRTTGHPQDYSALEILAVLRALRYNDYFVTISLENISLDRLAQVYDHFGHENICLQPRMGQDIPIQATEMQHSSILFQELSAIAMTDRKLRRLDFTNCIHNVPSQSSQESGDDKGSSIVEPLYRLCANQNTNVDWIVLNGIHLSRIDVDFVMAMLANRDCHLRAVEVGGCQLDIWSLRLLIAELPTQSQTMEMINISCNPGRLNPNISFSSEFTNCQSLHTVNLSRISVEPDPVPLIPAEILFSWRLEELRLSRTTLNESTLSVLNQYLRAHNSSPLQRLYVDHCGLRPEAIVRLLNALSSTRGNGCLHLDISGNKIDSIETIIPAIRENNRVTSLVWQYLDFDEPNPFKKLIQAFTTNTCIQHLDLSELLLDFQLNGEVLAALHHLFSYNDALRSLDISGNNSRLDNCSFGPQIQLALRGLFQNTTLKVLRIQEQNLSMDGIAVLADILKTNNSLQELHCDNNNTPLAGFSLLVEALQTNSTVQVLSNMDSDRKNHIQSVEGSILKAARPKDMIHHLGLSHAEKQKMPAEIFDAVNEVNSAVDAHWRHQQRRLKRYLERNRCIAAGESAVLVESDTESQNTTAAAEEKVVEMSLERLELDGETTEGDW